MTARVSRSRRLSGGWNRVKSGGALAFACLTPPSHTLYLDNGNTANQVVRVTGWED